MPATEEGATDEVDQLVPEALVPMRDGAREATAALVETVGPVHLRNAVCHHGRVGALVARDPPQGAVVKGLLRDGFHLNLRGLGVLVVPVECIGLGLHPYRRADPTVVEDPRAGVDSDKLPCTRLVVVRAAIEVRDTSETLGIGHAVDLRDVPDHAHFLLVPALAVEYMIVVAPEVMIVKEHCLDRWVVVPALAGSANFGRIVLVQDLITLEVQEPVAGAMGLGHVGLLGVYGPVRELIQIPDGVDEDNFVRPEGLDLLPRVVVGIRIAQGDNKFIHHRQQRMDRLDDRVVELGSVAEKRKAVDLHGPWCPNAESSTESCG